MRHGKWGVEKLGIFSATRVSEEDWCHRLCFTVRWTRDALTGFTLGPGKFRAGKLVQQWVLQNMQALVAFGATGIMHIIVSHLTNVGFLWVKCLCHCCVLKALFAETWGSVQWDDWFAWGLVAFLCLLGDEIDTYGVGFRNQGPKNIFFLVISAQYAVLLPSLEIALIYWPHFTPAFIPACSHRRLSLRLREPLLSYP